MTHIITDPSIGKEDLRNSPTYIRMVTLIKVTGDLRLSHFLSRRAEEVEQVVNLLDLQLLEHHSLTSQSLEALLERIDLALLIVNNREARLNESSSEVTPGIEFNFYDKFKNFVAKQVSI